MVDLHDGYDEVLDHRKMRKPKTTSDELIERQFKLIVEGLQVEYAGKLNGLIDLCADSRFIRAKKALYQRLPEEKATDLLHKIF